MELGNLAEWCAAGSNFIVASAAVGVVFLQRHFDRRRHVELVAFYSLTAGTGALGALKVIEDLQTDLYEQVRTSQPGQNRQWSFELGVGEETAKIALTRELWDPALIEHIAAVKAWAADARAYLALPAKDALFQLQYSISSREATVKSLRGMMQHFLKSRVGNRSRLYKR